RSTWSTARAMTSTTRPFATSSKAISAAAPAITTSSKPSPPAPRPWEERGLVSPPSGTSSAARVAKGVIQGGDRHERNRHRSGGAPQRGPAFHHRQGPLYRRHQPSGPSSRLFSALAPRPRQNQSDRQQGGGRDAGRARGAHRRRACRRQDRRPHLRLDDHLQ